VHLKVNFHRYNQALTPREKGVHREREEKLLRTFPPEFVPAAEFDAPMVLVDSDGVVATWYLPGALSARLSVRVCADNGLKNGTFANI
jgi:hypothetical protein